MVCRQVAQVVAGVAGGFDCGVVAESVRRFDSAVVAGRDSAAVGQFVCAVVT